MTHAPAPLLLPTLPPRAPDTHKGTYGSVLVVAGSARYPGAAVLAALGAARMGAGLVHLAVPAPVVPDVLPAVPFAIIERLPAGGDGELTARAGDALDEVLARAGAVVLGPGLGTGTGAATLVARLIAEVRAPLLLDADALNLVAARGVSCLAGRAGPTVLTPHPGEFGRLAGGDPPAGDQARSAAAAALARLSGAVVVLKGHHTVTADGRRLRVETAGNPGLARGGMGDVLAGAMGTLLAQLGDPAAAAALAVRLHALAGDLAAQDLGEESVLPEDVARLLGRAAALHRSA